MKINHTILSAIDYFCLVLAIIFTILFISDFYDVLKTPELYPFGTEMGDKGGFAYYSKQMYITTRIAELCLFVFYIIIFVRNKMHSSRSAIVHALSFIILIIVALPIIQST